MINIGNIIEQCNPCKCDNGGARYKPFNGWHMLVCGYCGDGVCCPLADDLLSTWNNDNPLSEPNKDQAWQQAQELAQAGKMDEAVVTVIKPSNPIDAALRPHVKKTADELPDLMDGILLWVDGQWRYTWLDAGGYWETDTDYMEVHDDQYWLPLPTFNPEREA